MAHYAYLNENNIVINVIVGNDENVPPGEWEKYYNAKRTSYNTRGGIYYDPITNQPTEDQSKAFRKNYAGVGYSYDVGLDAFIPPQPYPSWVLNTQSCLWEPPISYPNDGQRYIWDETTQSWKSINEN